MLSLHIIFWQVYLTVRFAHVKKTSKETLLALLMAAALVIALNFSPNSTVSPVESALKSDSHSKVLYIASYNDFYEFEVNDYLRAILGRRLAVMGEFVVEGNYEEVLARASLGLVPFLDYLVANGVTHLLVPEKNYREKLIYHRWSKHGTINIALDDTVFSEEANSGGDNPLVLLRINHERTSQVREVPNYEITWLGVRENFHALRRIINEGYLTTYLRAYEERTDVSWVFKGEELRLLFTSPSVSQSFILEVEFIAAYGELAPPQILQVRTKDLNENILLMPLEKRVVAFDVKSGDELKVVNLLGCNSGTSFDPVGADSRQFCYGVTDVRVSVTDSD
jgi:hypothetical protein